MRACTVWLIKGAQRTLSALFKRAKVDRGHPHRFRHTLASEILGRGGTVEDAANILAEQPRYDPPALCEMDPPNTKPVMTG
jgi:integrase